ncbi:Nucleolar protein 58 [Smittium mucronatum]|uniref:Nucleolar protein 58 n=1 Tax=Smittium mucronatum TaxID=133383 RepID=A0A1R0GRH5_9FUNG|nr:Nucleolar protein 58 [Smittium mucronatum]
MLVLYETAAGFALFKVLDEGKLKSVDNVYKDFVTPEKANQIVKLRNFHKFENTVEALSAATAVVEGKISKSLKSFLTEKSVEKTLKNEKLVVIEPKLGSAITKKLGISVLNDSAISNELFRGIRLQLDSLLVDDVSEADLHSFELGLSHSLSRYKLKFSPDKIDTMIIQAINLLDDLDKELNTYSMRVKEWYGWHFPELAKLVVDNLVYAQLILLVGMRTEFGTTDCSSVLPEEIETEVKQAAEISMGTEISPIDLANIKALCSQVVSITSYRTQLYDYLRNRMIAIAPNLTTLVGELVGARLISHAGSLMTLAKYPASTVQILGAEKALFRALKTKANTPKYGLIYHASLVGQASPKIKGKIARLTATKTVISARVDALGDSETPEVGIVCRSKVETRLRILEGRFNKGINKSNLKKNNTPKFSKNDNVTAYNPANDTTIVKDEPSSVDVEKKKKRKIEEPAADEETSEPKTEEEKPKSKKEKKDKKEKKEKKDKKEKKEKKDKKEKKSKEE